MNLEIHLEFAGKTSALDALCLLVGQLKRGPFYVEWAGQSMSLRKMLETIEKRPLMQAASCQDIVNLGFYGGPPGKKTWYKGTLASLLVDSYFCEVILQRDLVAKDRIPYADKIGPDEFNSDRRPTPPSCNIAGKATEPLPSLATQPVKRVYHRKPPGADIMGTTINGFQFSPAV